MVKQVIVIRKDLNMRRGKEIAQGSHASMAFLSNLIKEHRFEPVKLSDDEIEWLYGAFTKVCLQVNSEEELKAVHEKALEAGLESNLIVDNGTTEFNGVKTPTCCAIGPHQAHRFEGITTDLKLY